MRKILNIIYYWAPPLLWMGIIFFMSSQRRLTMTSNEAGDFVVFKSLHVVEYALLFFLIYRALFSVKFISDRFLVFCALPIAILYSMTDEFHQLFIPTRSGLPRDIIIDMIGMLIMYGIIKKVRLVRRLL